MLALPGWPTRLRHNELCRIKLCGDAAIKRAESVVESYFEGITRLLVWSNVVGKWKLEGQNHSKKKRCFYPFG